MKRFVALLLVLALTLVSVSAFAAGKLKVVQENYYTIESYGRYANVYAKVENIGDKPIKVNTGLLEVYNENGDPLTSTDYFNTYMTYLEPGQYTYVSASSEIEDNGAVDDYMLTIGGKSDNSHKIILLPCETKYEPNVKNDYWTHNYMYVTYTNNTEQPLYGINATFALLDAEGNILYVENDSLYDNRALNPGSSMTVRIDLPSSYVEYYEANGLVPVSVDAQVYVQVQE